MTTWQSPNSINEYISFIIKASQKIYSSCRYLIYDFYFVFSSFYVSFFFYLAKHLDYSFFSDSVFINSVLIYFTNEWILDFNSINFTIGTPFVSSVILPVIFLFLTIYNFESFEYCVNYSHYLITLKLLCSYKNPHTNHRFQSHKLNYL